MIIYAMSDLHGDVEAFEDSLSVVDFSDPKTLLILCGDYLDSAHQHPEFLTYIREFQEAHEGQVIVLMGNHEAGYLEELAEDLESASFCESTKIANPDVPLLRDQKTLEWLSDLPLFYETDTQIFVHAGIDEEAGEYWRVGTEDYYFYSKYPQTYGTFEKDIIAGHVGTFSMCAEHRVYWDGQAHFYLDGTTEKSKVVPVLKYDSQTCEYTSFVKLYAEADASRWSEYVVAPCCDGATTSYEKSSG